MAIIKRNDIYKCDRCGHETEDSGDTREMVSGSTNLSYKGSLGGKGYDGGWGGSGHEGKAWLCHDCSQDFLKFMKGRENATRN